MDIASRTTTPFIRFAATLLVIAVLYFGRDVLVPFALAALFAFMLSPLVEGLCRTRLPRALSVVTVTIVVFSCVALVLWFLGRELHHLAEELPDHRANIQKRVAALQSVGENGVVGKLRQLATDIAQPSDSGVVEPPTVAIDPATPTLPAPASDNGMLSKAVDITLTTLAQVLGTAALVILFVVFMLLRQDDIAQRIIRLVGYSRLTLTTKAMDEVGSRVSRYLLTQFAINSLYGICLGAGLAFLGVPYVVLWGVLAALFRFIPYVGPWMVAVLPSGLSLAVFDGWSQPLMVIGFIATLELVTNTILEPMLYGQSVGVSDFSLLLAITFWTWLWGGIGLVLATPLTVCFVVFCKHVPSLEWVDILMGEKATPQPHLQFYQHLLADDEDAALTLIKETAREKGIMLTLDEMALPALTITRREAVLGRLENAEAENIFATIRSAISLLEEQQAAPPDDAPEAAPVAKKIMGRTLNGEADERALEMLAQSLPAGFTLDISSEPRLTGELVQIIRHEKPVLFCISAMPPGAQLATSVLCRRLRSQFPEMKILVCRWSLPGQTLDPKPLLEAGANWVASSISEAIGLIEKAAI